ncbi:hypothetical protein MMC11_006823 [Xylographa trunciseda]|nr:hypothetical protein [Xylographa trunciseda]
MIVDLPRETRATSEPDILDIDWFAVTPPPTLSVPIESQAMCYFFRNYVCEDSRFSRGYFDYLPSIFSSNGAVGSAITDAVISLGMVGLSNTKNASDIMISAKERYNSAIRATNSALRDVEAAKADQTLITVMLLGLYETNTCSSPRSMQSWTQHISGALKLLYLRGKEQVQTRTGHQLFTQLRSQVIINCMQRRARVPDDIAEWTFFAMAYETEQEIIASTLCCIIIKFCNLRASMDSFHDYRQSARVVSAAFDIDAELADWAVRCPAQYIYNTVTMQSRSESVFSDYYHTYDTIWTAYTWNSYRSIRILLNEMLLEQLRHLTQYPLDYLEPYDEYSLLPYETQILCCKSLLVQLTQDICASVPFYLGYHNQEDGPESMQVPPVAAGGNLLLWPLYTAACTNVVSDMMRLWVIGRLEKIAEVMGIRQATALAHLLHLRKDPPGRNVIDLDLTQEVSDECNTGDVCRRQDPRNDAHVLSVSEITERQIHQIKEKTGWCHKWKEGLAGWDEASVKSNFMPLGLKSQGELKDRTGSLEKRYSRVGKLAVKPITQQPRTMAEIESFFETRDVGNGIAGTTYHLRFP